MRRPKEPEPLDLIITIRAERSLRARLDAYRQHLASQHLRLSAAAVARLALCEGLDALERKSRS